MAWEGRPKGRNLNGPERCRRELHPGLGIPVFGLCINPGRFIDPCPIGQVRLRGMRCLATQVPRDKGRAFLCPFRQNWRVWGGGGVGGGGGGKERKMCLVGALLNDVQATPPTEVL